MESSPSDTKDVDLQTLEQLACHADELQTLIMDAADRHADEYLYLAARSLDRLNDDLNELVYD